MTSRKSVVWLFLSSTLIGCTPTPEEAPTPDAWICVVRWPREDPALAATNARGYRVEDAAGAYYHESAWGNRGTLARFPPSAGLVPRTVPCGTVRVDAPALKRSGWDRFPLPTSLAGTDSNRFPFAAGETSQSLLFVSWGIGDSAGYLLRGYLDENCDGNYLIWEARGVGRAGRGFAGRRRVICRPAKGDDCRAFGRPSP